MKLQNVKYVVLFNKGFTLTDEFKENEDLTLKQTFGYCAEEIHEAKASLMKQTDEGSIVKVEFDDKVIFGLAEECWDGTLHAQKTMGEIELNELIHKVKINL